ncbi:MAG: Crp/Fnr family transcriptional regulator [Bacteroidota bacterium]
MHPVRQYIHRYVSLGEEDWQSIANKLTRRSVARSETLLQQGQVCRHLYFLETGLLRFLNWKDGRDITKYFTVAPYCFTSQRSFTMEIAANESIEALEDSIVWQMSKADSDALLQLPAWSEFVRKLVQEVQYYTDCILEELQNETAEARYRKMLQINDPLLQRVPIKHLASYLGIAPQSLSRIRKKIALAERK